MRLDFAAPSEAAFMLDFASEPEPRSIAVGLDGVYRPSRGGRPVLARGGWQDPSTFVIDYDEGPGLAHYTFRFKFEGSTVAVDIVGVGTFTARMRED
jgi:hypothetical protein